MKDRISDFLASCSDIDFGAVNLSEGEREFCKELNDEILLLCKSLPESTQADAILFLMRYSGASFGEDLDFFKNFYAPSWSIIYWLIRSYPDDARLAQRDMEDARTAHTMAMLLHSLDDHINDHELPASHLTLLLRSQSWMIMNSALSGLADGVDQGARIVQDLFNDYYSSICGSEEIESLDGYCDLFRKQMATWFIVPVLMTKRMTSDPDFTDAIQKAYGSFGIAWRLLDDIKDLETDFMKRTHSSIYVCLSGGMRSAWERGAGQIKDANGDDRAKAVLNHILENRVVEGIRQRICSELESAASVADDYNMAGLADEFRCLARPLKNRCDCL